MKRPSGFGVNANNVIKPRKYHFFEFVGERHFSQPNNMATTELIKLLQKELVRPLHGYTNSVLILVSQSQRHLSVLIIRQSREASSLLQQKEFIWAVVKYVYAGSLLIMEKVCVVGIYLMKGLSWGLDQIARSTPLALIVFLILFGILFSKLKRYKQLKEIEKKEKEEKKDPNPYNNLPPDDRIDPNDPPFFFPPRRRPKRR